MNRIGSKLLAIAASLVIIMALTGRAAAQDDTAALYKAKCGACHGADGRGDTPMGKKLGVKAFNDPDVAKSSDATWTEVTSKGKGKMPAYAGKLTDDQIKGLVKYMRGLAKAK